MRILYLHQYFSTLQGGNGTRSYEFSRRFIDNGHEVDVVTCPSNLPLSYRRRKRFYNFCHENINVHVCNTEYANAMNFQARIKSFFSFLVLASITALKLPRADIVYASSTPLTVGLLGVFAAAVHRSTMIFEIRDCWPEIPIALGWIRSPLLKRLTIAMLRFVLKFADHVVVLSPDMKNSVLKYSIPEQKISVVPNCCDTDLIRQSDQKLLMKEKLGFGPDRIIAIHLGAMGQVNGLSAVLDAAVILKQLAPRVRIILMGDGRERPVLEEKKAREQIENVTILPPVSKKEVPMVLAASDIGLMTVLPIPALYANSANKFFDYLSAALPVVMNYGGWKADLLNLSGAGIAVTPNDNLAFARAIAGLANDEEHRKRAGQAARQLAEAKFKRDDMAMKLMRILDRTVRSGPRIAKCGTHAS